jgi:putative tryptophan/tyrosine transport system substrate-binding protein
VTAFREGLEKLGWTEGRNLKIDTRWAVRTGAESVLTGAGSVQQFARELVALQPDLILSPVNFTTAALLQETRTIPIVLAIASDPVGSGFIASLAQPGGNVTGFMFSEASLGSKWLELLKEVAPRVSRVAFLHNPKITLRAGAFLTSLIAASGSFAVEVVTAPVQDPFELETVIAAQAREPNSGLISPPDTFVFAHREQITSLAARYRIPAVYPYRTFAELGGLLSYGDDLADNFRRAATYADRILKGARPGELPVQASVKFNLVINLKSAKALGLAIPTTLLARADEVIE